MILYFPGRHAETMVDRSEFLPQSGLRLASGRRRQAHDDAGHDEVGTYMLVVLFPTTI
jgi:hypothetical protein